MPLHPPASPPHPRRQLPRALLCLVLALVMSANIWWQQALAGNAEALPVMAICSAANAGASGGAPAHLAIGHCQLCCGGQAAPLLPQSAPSQAAAPSRSYPLAPAARTERSASLAPGAPRARAPPSA